MMFESGYVARIGVTLIVLLVANRSDGAVVPPPRTMKLVEPINIKKIYPGGVKPFKAGDDKIVVMFHGYNSSRAVYAGMKADVLARSNKTTVWDYDWSADTDPLVHPLPHDLISPGGAHGQAMSFFLRHNLGNYKHIQIISHSAGTFPNEFATRILNAKTDLTIHQTFLDAFTPGGIEAQMGRFANCAEHYYNVENAVGNLTWLPDTHDFFPHAANYDVTAFNSSVNPIVGHSFPIGWYENTILGNAGAKVPKSMYNQWGYGFSKMVADGADGLAGFPKAWPPPLKIIDFNRRRTIAPDGKGGIKTTSYVQPTKNSGLQRKWNGSLSHAHAVDTSADMGTFAFDSAPDESLAFSMNDPTGMQSDPDDFAWAAFEVPNGTVDPTPLNFVSFDYTWTTMGYTPDEAVSFDAGLLTLYAVTDTEGFDPDPAVDNWVQLHQIEERFSFDHGLLEASGEIFLTNLPQDLNHIAFRLDGLDQATSLSIQSLDFGYTEPPTLVPVPEPATGILMALTTVLLTVALRDKRS